MKYSDLSSKKRSYYCWINCAAASLLAVALAGCGGGSSNNDSTPVAAVTTTTLPPATSTVPVPTGAAPITLTATTPAATFAALTPAVPAVSVTIASPPKVTFSLTDGNGNAIIGFGKGIRKRATDAVGANQNLSFALAKLIPETSAVVGGRTLTTPSRWVSYIVTGNPTLAADKTTIVPGVPTLPTTDSIGTLEDHGNGTYTYTFGRDITKVKDVVLATAETATKKNADLDDLTFDPNLVHRLTIQISGAAPGTGTNTPDGVQVTTSVPMLNALNVIYDFIPATGKEVTASGRDIAATQKCNDCHQSLGGFPEATASDSDARFHGGNRNEVRYCVVCHTEQVKYGSAEATQNAAGNFTSATTFKVNGLSVVNLPSHIHKIHMSANLTKTGYNANIKYEEACKFPQDIRNCTKCHDGSATSTAKTAQGDNWMNVPNRGACGACHDGINFDTGGGKTLAEFKDGTAGTGHAGGAQLDDAACGFCHTPALIPVYHIPVTPPSASNSLLLGGTNNNTNAASIASNRDRLPAGAIKVSYEISSVSRNASKNPVMVFRMLQNGAAVPFNTFATAAVNPATGQKELWPNFMGAPSVYFVFAVPQDGIVAPADFNGSTNVYLRSLWNGAAAATGNLSGPDATTGMYTATLTGVTIPDNAVMLTGGLGYSYNVKTTLPLTQTNLAQYPTAAATGTGLTAGMPNATGGLIVITPDAQKVASAGAAAGGTGGAYTGRRTIVEDARCNKCHLELGTFTEDAFHAGQRNDGTTCSWCHNPNQTTSGWSGDSTSFVHAIHAAAKRGTKFTWHAASATDGFYTIGYPGILKNCETCHTPDGYDFSSAAGSSALPNRLYRTVATGTTAAATFSTSPDIAQTAGTVYGSGFSFAVSTGVTAQAAASTLVNSPIATACFACHDSTVARQHMESNGASIYRTRGAPDNALAKAEQCMFCHSSTSVFGLGIKAVHVR